MEGGGLKDHGGTAHICFKSPKEHNVIAQLETEKFHKKKSKFKRMFNKLFSRFSGKTLHMSSNHTVEVQESCSEPGKDELLTNVGSEGSHAHIIMERMGKVTDDSVCVEKFPIPEECSMDLRKRKQCEVRSSLNPSSPCTGASASEDETSVMKVINSCTSNSASDRNKEEGIFKAVMSQNTITVPVHNKTITSSESSVSVSHLKSTIVHDTDSLDEIKRGTKDPYESMQASYPTFTKRSIKYLYRFRPFHRRTRTLNMMHEETEIGYCHPRYADIELRKDSLKGCTNQQLKQYNYHELARTGWFFNQRALITFCCGMEMPRMPNGQPLDVHRSLSPQCHFALSIPIQTTYREVSSDIPVCDVATPNVEEHSLEASGGNTIIFKAPIQVTDDGSGHEAHYYASEWTLDYGSSSSEIADRDLFNFPSEASFYLQNVVTNTTQLPSEHLPRYSETAQRRLGGREQDPAERNGQLHMRGNVENPLGNARLMRELDAGAGHQHHMQFLPVDQINVDGEHGNDYQARYPQFGFPAIRSWTYEGWPRTHTQTAETMAEAGFFYAGFGDSALCYSCGIGVRHWKPEDDPWIEHARWRPACVFLQAIKGQEFIDVVRDLCRNSGSTRRRPTMQEVRAEMDRRARGASGEGKSGNS